MMRLVLLLLAGTLAGCASPPTNSGMSDEPVNVLIDTSMGPIKVELLPKAAPVTVEKNCVVAGRGRRSRRLSINSV